MCFEPGLDLMVGRKRDFAFKNSHQFLYLGNWSHCVKSNVIDWFHEHFLWSSILWAQNGRLFKFKSYVWILLYSRKNSPIRRIIFRWSFAQRPTNWSGWIMFWKIILLSWSSWRTINTFCCSQMKASSSWMIFTLA